MSAWQEIPWLGLELARWTAVRLRLPYRFSALYGSLLRPSGSSITNGMGRREGDGHVNLSSLKVLVVGQQEEGSTGGSRLKAFRTLCGSVERLNASAYIQGLPWLEHLQSNHFYIGERVKSLNLELLKKAEGFSPQLLWVEKGLHIWPETLKQIRQIGCPLLVHFSPDNQRVFANQSRHYLRALGLYDLQVTTKSQDMTWLRQCGARGLRLMGKGFDPEIHRPIILSAEEQKRFGCEVGFVGHWEPWRERLLLQILEKGYSVKVWGGGWRCAHLRRHPLFSGAVHLVGQEYAKAICGAKVSLCLLSRWFGDLTTARSVEIPACGGFLLAERNEEHKALFREGGEAEYYSSIPEMFQKIDYYLRREEERRAIAQAGHRRCVEKYSNSLRLKELLSRILEER